MPFSRRERRLAVNGRRLPPDDPVAKPQRAFGPAPEPCGVWHWRAENSGKRTRLACG